MSKNYLHTSFLFVFCVALIFSLLSLINYDDIPVSIKPIKFFADILQTDSTTQAEEFKKLVVVSELDSVIDNNSSDSVPVNEIDSMRTVPFTEDVRISFGDIEQIQNFNESNSPFELFFEKLALAKLAKAKVRIAWFGDSFTDADIVVSDLRDTLQSVYGGNGVGFMPITHESPAFRRSVIHAFSGWSTSSIIAKNGSKDFGINGAVYSPDSSNYLRFEASKRFKNTRKFDIFRLFYSSSKQTVAYLSINDTIRNELLLAPSSTPSMVSVGVNDIRKVKLRVSQRNSAVFYGVSLEDSTGLYIDNFSIKGNSGLGLLAIPNENLMAFDSLLNYDLIVLQFGLNAVNAQTRTYTSYMDGMSHLINKFKRTFPGTPILLMAVSDRSERLQGQYVTMKSIKGLVKAQEALAVKHRLLFWNLYQAMGGENSMADFVRAKPPLANKDYTHLNFIGGKHIGHKFARSLIFEAEKYKVKRKEDAEN